MAGDACLFPRIHTGPAEQRRREIDVRGHRLALLAVGLWMGRVGDDQGHVILLLVGGFGGLLGPLTAHA